MGSATEIKDCRIFGQLANESNNEQKSTPSLVVTTRILGNNDFTGSRKHGYFRGLRAFLSARVLELVGHLPPNCTRWDVEERGSRTRDHYRIFSPLDILS